MLRSYSLQGQALGQGEFGVVRMARHRGLGGSGPSFAVKTIAKCQVDEKIRMENELMRTMDHPNVIKLYKSYEDDSGMHIVMECCDGGELFDRLNAVGSFSEEAAAAMMQQLLRATHYLHSRLTVHRDLKLENCILQTKGGALEETVLKVIDFGCSRRFEPEETLRTKIGSEFYRAPQVIQGRYNELCDEWSCGVIMHMMLCGEPPFYAETDGELLTKILVGVHSLALTEGVWASISDEAKDLVRGLLKMAPGQRFSAQQALEHTWLHGRAPKAQAQNFSSTQLAHLRSHRVQNRFQAAVMLHIARQLEDSSQGKELKEIFFALDRDGDGGLTETELCGGIPQTSVDRARLLELMPEIDQDGDGTIQFGELLAAALPWQEFVDEEAIRSAFAFFDKDRDGKISKEELAGVLTQAELPIAFAEVDIDGNGAIDLAEFTEMMLSAPEN